MAVITPGTGGTLQGTSLELQLWQWLQWVQRLEANVTANPQQINYISGQKDLDTSEFTGNWIIGVSQSINTDGTIKLIATNHISDSILVSPFTPGTGGTFKNSTYAGYGLELIAYTANLQRLGNNTSKPNVVTGSYNAVTQLYSGTFRIPYYIDDNWMDVPKNTLEDIV